MNRRGFIPIILIAFLAAWATMTLVVATEMHREMTQPDEYIQRQK